jgi:hypothetical protein
MGEVRIMHNNRVRTGSLRQSTVTWPCTLLCQFALPEYLEKGPSEQGMDEQGLRAAYLAVLCPFVCDQTNDNQRDD